MKLKCVLFPSIACVRLRLKCFDLTSEMKSFGKAISVTSFPLAVRVMFFEWSIMNLLIRLFWFLLGWILCRKMDGEYIN